jgi:O-antigen/teichoic acid export membrane protein
VLNLRYIRVKPFDTTTTVGRERERYRLAGLAVITSLVNRVLSASIMILAVRLTAPYLGEERFGLWMTIASFAIMLNFLDVGAGNALANRVAHAVVKNDSAYLRQVISGGLGVLGLISCVICLVLTILVGIMPWHILLKSSQAVMIHQEMMVTLYWFAGLLGAHVFSASLFKVFLALQKLHKAHILSLYGHISSMLMVIGSAYYQLGVPELLISAMFGPVLTLFVLLFVLYRHEYFSWKNIWSAVQGEYKHLLHAGSGFMLIQMGMIIAWGLDSLLISSTLGVAAVASFSVIQRIYQVAAQPIAMINGPLWPAYADANIRCEKIFIKKTLLRSLKYTFLYLSVISILVVWNGLYLVDLLTANTVQVGYMAILAFGLWTIVEGMGNAFQVFLGGCNLIRQQVYFFVSLCLIAFPLKLYFLNTFGVAAMLLVFSVAYLLIFGFWYGVIFRKDVAQKLY